MRRSIRNLVRPSLLTILAGAPACRPARNPELVVPPPAPSPLRLEGAVVSVGSERPIVGASVRLIPGGIEAERRDTLDRVSQPNGTFVFDSLTAGRYVLLTRYIGHRLRYDTLVLATSPPPRLTIPMVPAPTRLGAWPPDSDVVSAARAQRGRWMCDRDPQSINEAQQGWMSWLLTPHIRESLGLPAASDDVARIERVRDRRLCRRAADAYDEAEGATGLATTVFRFGRFYLVSQPTWPTEIIFDERWRPVWRTIQE